MGTDRIAALASRNDGLITLSQLAKLGFTRRLASGRLARGVWRRILPGVYQTSLTPVTWHQRARAALMWGGPRAVLSHESAAWLLGLVRREPSGVDLTLPRTMRRRSPAPQWLRIHHVTRIPPSRESPLRHATLNETLVALLDEAPSLDDAVGLVTSAIRKGLKPESIRSRVLRARDLRRRALILEILADAEEGVESPLEYRFHHDVEDAHGLPQSVRQEWRKVGGRWIRSDCRYAGFGVVVELDGELAHPGKATPADLLRDNDVVLTAGEITLRYRWPHVAGTPCAVARQVATALTARGWEGEIRACGPRCGAV